MGVACVFCVEGMLEVTGATGTGEMTGVWDSGDVGTGKDEGGEADDTAASCWSPKEMQREMWKTFKKKKTLLIDTRDTPIRSIKSSGIGRSDWNWKEVDRC